MLRKAGGRVIDKLVSLRKVSSSDGMLELKRWTLAKTAYKMERSKVVWCRLRGLPLPLWDNEVFSSTVTPLVCNGKWMTTGQDGVSHCRMKRGLILTGVGDKGPIQVLEELWRAESANSYQDHQWQYGSKAWMAGLGRLGESDPADPDSGRVGSVEPADSNGV
ncbi:hypothetical protein Taro_046490 [Colocasia esculenta]|uniref:DUF4283 domain-containing protein n=1 Tax=Colocasia esculenta TaxID=4460 RepID=A0A843X676_COLES|nr:hypothetical protein [Colocasia esculenta]